MKTVLKQGLTNHVALVLDASASMSIHHSAVIRAVDEQIASLARLSEKMDQETRVTVVLFSDRAQVLIYDKDVLRLPSIREYYRPAGMTALVDATLLAIDDLSELPEKYADHAYFCIVLTDGQENASKNRPSVLSGRVAQLADNWTLSALVPDVRGEDYAQRCGFPPGNIGVWDTRTAAGFDQAASTIRQATETFMTNRAAGIRSSRSVFSTGSDAVNAASVRQAGLTPLPRNHYQLVPVPRTTEIRPFVQECGYTFRTGCAYYELSKTETIQASKQIAVLEKKTDKIYTGPEARNLIGLPDMNVRVKPDYNDEFKIFVQSTSVNRKLVAGTRLLIMT